jgi:hypothetical protein
VIRQVRLELARCHEFPEGSRNHGYELSLPLTADGHLDRDGWHRGREATGFRRFWDDEEEHGRLHHGRQGWALSFGAGPDGEEVFFKGDAHRFAEGEYVSIRERDGVTRTFRVAAVR